VRPRAGKDYATSRRLEKRRRAPGGAAFKA